MVNLKLLENQSTATPPKRELKFILFWCREGTADLVIDEHAFHLVKNQAITITSGQVYSYRKISGQSIVLDFTLDYFCKDDKDIELIFHNGLFCHFGMNAVITVTNDQVFNHLLRQIAAELSDKPYQYLVSVHSCIELLLIALNRAKLANGDEIWKPDALFLKFLEAVRNNFPRNFSLAAFADKLATTEAKLNELSRLHTSKTAQNVIFSLTVSEAKRLLIYQDLSIKEIAYQLGFHDPFYFSNFFKKHARMSPKAYKKEFAL